ncbi:MAG TPA: N-acetylglucosamine-6-phosphate deacetylase, partial [Limnochordales bacterium]
MEFQLGGGLVVLPGGRLRRGWVGVRGGKVAYVGRWPAAGVARVELPHHILCPGFIDLHVHGGGGHSLDEPHGVEGFAAWAPSRGVTAFLASPLFSSPEQACRRLPQLAAARPGHAREPAARCLGIYLEGPFVQPARRGALPPGWPVAPGRHWLERLMEAAAGRLRVMVVAPELPGALEIIGELRGAGVVPALGHTDADYETFWQGVRAGAGLVTHCFNAMRGIHHREPGAAGAAMVCPLPVELVADGHHVHPAVLRLALACKGTAGVILVSDAVAPAGTAAAGEPQASAWELGGQAVRVEQGRVVLADGTLAGSACPLDEVVRFAVRGAGVDLGEAVEMVTANPARVLGLAGRLGELAEGCLADITVLDGE